MARIRISTQHDPSLAELLKGERVSVASNGYSLALLLTNDKSNSYKIQSVNEKSIYIDVRQEVVFKDAPIINKPHISVYGPNIAQGKIRANNNLPRLEILPEIVDSVIIFELPDGLRS